MHDDGQFNDAVKYYSQGDFAKAEDCFVAYLQQRAVEVFADRKNEVPVEEKSLENDMVAANRLHLIFEKKGDLQGAVHYAKLGATVAEQSATANPKKYAAYLADFVLRAADIQYQLCQTAEARQYVLEALESYMPAIHLQNTTADLKAWLNLCKLGDTSPANKLRLQAIFLKLAAWCALENGCYSGAEDRLLFAENLLANNTDPGLVKARTVLTLYRAMALTGKGALIEAKTLLTNTDLLDNNSDANHIFHLELLAKIHLLQGNLGEAENLLGQVVGLHQTRQHARGYAISLVNLACVKIYLNQPTEGIALLNEAETYCDVNALDALRLTIQLQKAIASTKGLHEINATTNINYLASETNLPQNDSVTQWGLDHFGYFESRCANAILRILANPSQANDVNNGLQQAFAGTDSALIKHRLLSISYLAAVVTGGKPPAGELVNDSCNYFEKEGIKTELWQLLAYKKMATENNGDQALLLQKINAILGDISATLGEDEQAIFYLNKWTETEEALKITKDKIAALQSRTTGHLLNRITDFFTNGTLINSLLTAVDAYKQKKLHEAEVFTLANMSKKPHWLFTWLFMPTDKAIISFLSLPDALVIVTRGRKLLRARVVGLPRPRLRELVANIQKSTGTQTAANRGAGRINHGYNSFDNYKQACGAFLTETALGEVLSGLPGSVTRISFVLDDLLHRLSFAALFIDDKFLIQTHAVSYGLRNFDNGSQQKNTPTKTSLVAAVSNSVSTETITFPALPGVVAEAKAVIPVLQKLSPKGVTTLENNEVSADVVLAYMKGTQHVKPANLLHVACHGMFNHQQPASSGLVFPNNEMLTLATIRNNGPFSTVEQLTLSSCLAADSFVLPGRWVVSLPEAFYLAGVQRILGCIWLVPDNSTAGLMADFYGNLLNNPADIALQRAQLALLGGKDTVAEAMYQQLAQWAGFCLYGNV